MGQEVDTQSKGTSIVPFCDQIKHKYKESQRNLFRNKVICKFGKGSNGEKKEFQSIYYQVHMSAQFFSSWISNADYLIPQSAPVDLLLSQLKHALVFFFLITPLASCLCISAGPGQRKFSNHLTVPVTGDLFFFLILHRFVTQNESLGAFLLPVQPIRSLVPLPLIWKYHLPSQSHLFCKARPRAQ